MWPFRRGAREPAGRRDLLPAAQARYVVVDTELTGLDERRDSIVSIGGLRVLAGRIVIGERFYREVRPEGVLPPESILVHGITPEELRECPRVEDALTEFAAFCGQDILVGHFLEIDLCFLGAALARASLPALANPVLDTWPLYDWLARRVPGDGSAELPRLRDPRLPRLAEALGVPCRSQHNALADAYVTAQVFQRLLRRLERCGVTTTGELLRIGKPTRAPDRLPADALPLT